VPAGPRAATSKATVALPVLLGWSLVAVGIAWRQGEWTSGGMLLVVLGFGCVTWALASGRELTVPTARELAIPVTVALGAAVVHPPHRFMHTHGASLLAVQVLAAATAAATAASLLPRFRGHRASWALPAAVAVATGLVTIVVVNDPRIDVWYLLQQSSDGLLHGQDMYRQHWAHSHGLQAVYPYLPLTTVLLAPFRWLLGDVRFGLLLAGVLSSYAVRRSAPAAPAALPLLLLVQPHWPFLVDQSWTEPLVLALLAGSLLALERGRSTLAVVALAGALACKQHVVLLLPLFALWPAFGWRRTLASGGLAGLAVLPWFIAGPRDMWHDAVHANLALGVLLRALCLPSLFAHLGWTVGFWFLLTALGLAYTVVLLRAPRTPAGLALGSAFVLLTTALANKQSFFNHYTLGIGLLVVALGLAGASGNAGGAQTRPKDAWLG
jgi:hypothetical protein